MKCSPLQTSSVAVGGARAKKSNGRCRFCRSKGRYVPGQRSFDQAAAKLFGKRKEWRAESRRAISEDRRSDGQTTEDTTASSSSATTASSSFDRPSPGTRPAQHSTAFFSTPPFLRRQERTEAEPPPSPNLLSVPSPVFPNCSLPAGGSGDLDHGLRTPPAPPAFSPRFTVAEADEEEDEQATTSVSLSHRMAHELGDYLTPPPRSSATLNRANTDPTSAFAGAANQPRRPSSLFPSSPPYHGSRRRRSGSGAAATSSSASGFRPVLHLSIPAGPLAGAGDVGGADADARANRGQHQHQHQPTSPPPAYSDVVKEVREGRLRRRCVSVTLTRCN